jgi:hypothetical protein
MSRLPGGDMHDLGSRLKEALQSWRIDELTDAQLEELAELQWAEAQLKVVRVRWLAELKRRGLRVPWER